MNQTEAKTIRLAEGDNVVVALKDLDQGESIGRGHLACRQRIPAGHKVAIHAIDAHEPVRKYGHIIGFASTPIAPGDHVHTHNLEMGSLTLDYAMGRDARPTVMVPADRQATFKGLPRADGRVGTRNYIGILATVSCSASVARFIADAFPPEELASFPEVDGFLPLIHGTGCSMIPDSEGFVLLQRTLAGYARHPNFAGVLLVGLGCEVNQIDCLMENMRLPEGPFLRTIAIQDAGGTEKTVKRAISIIREMLFEANRTTRKAVPASHLVLALECGGSDAYSGITANPALGAAVDLLVAQGGTAILSETPEIYGAEHLLTRRAANREAGEKLVARVRWWEEYTAHLGGEINNNPTPGNKAGGLTNILEKSLGAAAKAGSTNLVEVYGYAEPVLAKGLVFMDTPGADLPSIAGMVAGGANLIAFTTGRGSVCGFKPVPALKLASHSDMYRRLEGDMDINCGLILEGKTTVEEMGEVIFRRILETASGKKTKSESLGFGDVEFVPWQMGPVM
jgi:altronate hydrolase